jgi:hypothetical protein
MWLAPAGAVSAQEPVVETNAEGNRVARVLESRRPAPPLTATDQAEIQNLYARSIQAFNDGSDDGRAFAASFVPEGILIDGTTGELSQGSIALAALARKNAPPAATVPTTRHLLHNLVIERAPEGASVKAFVAVVRVVDGQQASVVDSGQYWDVLEKTSQGWRIRKRNFHRATIAPPNPGAVVSGTTPPRR